LTNQMRPTCDHRGAFLTPRLLTVPRPYSNVRGVKSSRGSLHSSHASSMKRYRLHDNDSRLRTSRPSTQRAPESKVHTRKPYDAVG